MICIPWEQSLNPPFTLKFFVSGFVEICPVILEKKILKFPYCYVAISLLYPLEKCVAPTINKHKSPHSRMPCAKFGQTNDGQLAIRKTPLSS